MKKRPLNPQQLKFVKEYIILGNATEAARRAGYAEKWCGKIGPAMVGNSRIQQEVNKQARKIFTRRDVTMDKVLTELARVAFTNLDDVANWTKTKLNFIEKTKIPKQNRSAIKSISKKTGNTSEMKIEMHDKTRALETLLKHLQEPKNGNQEGQGTIQLKYRPGDSKREGEKGGAGNRGGPLPCGSKLAGTAKT